MSDNGENMDVGQQFTPIQGNRVGFLTLPSIHPFIFQLARLISELKLEALHYLNREQLDKCQQSNREWKNIIVRYGNKLARQRVASINFIFIEAISAALERCGG